MLSLSHVGKCVAICFSLLNAVRGGADASSTSSPVTECSFIVSEGDRAVGIRAAADLSCASGGLGCLMDTCRYCKIRETPQSEHLMACSSLDQSFPTLAPSTADTTLSSCDVSFGDTAAGINAVEDASCIVGGLGCFDGHCRFCKVRETSKSAHLGNCIKPTATATSPTPTREGPVGGALELTTTPYPATSSTVEIPAENRASAGTTLVPASTPASSAVECPVKISSRDVAVGIQLIRDDECVNGGVGCVYGVCRFCKVRGSLQSAHLNRCSYYGKYFDGDDGPVSNISAAPVPTPTPAPTSRPAVSADTTCAAKVATGDTVVGVSAVSDTTCAGVTPEVGCFEQVCRYCQVFETSKSYHLKACPVTTPSPDADGLLGGTLDIGPVCTTTVSAGDASVGIDIVAYDCAGKGGVGCINATCRFCRVRDTPESLHLATCVSVLSESAPTATPQPTSSSSTSQAAISLTCTSKVTSGDFNVGIDIYTDVTCVAEGVGCFQDVCRYCKRYDTAQSSHFITCASIDVTYGSDIGFVTDPSMATSSTPTTSAPSPTPTTLAPSPTPTTITPATTSPPTATPAPTTTPAPVTTSPVPTTTAPAVTTTAPVTSTPTATPDSAGCAAQVPYGDSQVGISAFTDPSCASGGLGCFTTLCRFCRKIDTEQSLHLLACPATVTLVKLAADKSSADSASDMSAILDNDTAKLAIGIAACIGTVIVAAIFAAGVKRATRLLLSSPSSSLHQAIQEPEVETHNKAEEVKAATPV